MSSGGGSSSGEVSYPDYMESRHENWLGRIDDNIDVYMNNGPWIYQAAFVPDTDIGNWESEIANYYNIINALAATTDWTAFAAATIAAIAAPTTAAVADAAVTDIPAIGDLVVTDVAVTDAAVTDVAVTDMDDPVDVSGITDAEIIADTAAFANQLDDEITTKVLPRLRCGYRNIGAVVSSAFAIGQSVIEGFRDRDVARHATELRLAAAIKNVDVDLENERFQIDVNKTNLGKDVQVAQLNMGKNVSIATANLEKATRVALQNSSKNVEVGKTNVSKDVSISTANLTKAIEIARANLEKNRLVTAMNIDSTLKYGQIVLMGAKDMSTLHINNAQMWSDYTKLYLESRRIKIVAKKEQNDVDMRIDEKNAVWNFEMFQYGANMLAAISGGTAAASAAQPSTLQSAIGGGLSGAAAGAMIGTAFGGPGIGTAIGGIIGLASGFF